MYPKVSVIIPIHNPGVYLRQCLDTVLGQTLQEIEIICVNDGSTDESAFILQEYAQKDPRIKIITQECQGAGIARNKGLEIASGDYLSFLDADDFFEDTMLEYMYYAAKRDLADIVICAHYIYNNRQKQDVEIKYPLQEAIEKSPLTPEQAAPFLFDISYPGACNKLFKKTFVEENKIMYSSVPRGEDLFFCWQALVKASKISVHPIPFFHYRIETLFQSTSVDGKPQTIVLFLKKIAELYKRISQSSLMCKWEKSFVSQVYKCLRHELEDRTALEKRKSLKLIQKELPNNLLQKLFFNSGRPSVSLILCVYNGEKYLVECLESLIHQTLKNIEIICVDDASTDNSLKILNEYASKDKRIKVLQHSTNQKLSIARRTAMTKVTAEYVLYIDADDYLDLDTCESLYFYTKIYNLDMCSFMSMEFLDKTREDFEIPYHRLTWLANRSVSSFTVKKLKNVLPNVAVTSGLTLYKNDFLKENSIEWLNEQIFFEDTPFFTKALFRTKKFGALKETFLHKRTHDQCITQNRDKHFTDWCKIILYVLEIVKESGDKEILDRYIQKYTAMGWNIYVGFSYELKIRYEKDMLNFCSSLVQKYGKILPTEMHIWYYDLTTIAPDDFYRFTKAKKSIDVDFSQNSIFNSFYEFYHHLKKQNLYEKYHQNYLNYLRQKFENKLFSCTVSEKENLLLNFAQKLPKEVFQKAFFASNQPAVSIILPVHNMELYLPQCLDSLIYQTLKNIEIICVDDGSTDKSLTILNEYASRDARIKVLTQTNQKQSIARRNAMKIASGEYIQFVDADDYIDLNTCECLYLYSKIHDLDMLLFAATDFQEETNETVNIPYHHLVWIPENFIPIFSYKNIQETIHQAAVTACLSFYRYDFLKENHIEWLDESLWYEDTPFFIEGILKAKRIGAFKRQFYHRRLHGKNTIQQMKTNYSDFCKIIQKTIDISKEYADEHVFGNIFYGYLQKLFANYQRLPEYSQKTFTQDLINVCTYLNEKYDLPFPVAIQKWYDNLIEAQQMALWGEMNVSDTEKTAHLVCRNKESGGLCNRLKNLFSFIRHYQPNDVLLLWPKSGYVLSAFKDLFTFDYPVQITEYHSDKEIPYDSLEFGDETWKFFVNEDELPDGFSKTPFTRDGKSIDFEYERIPQNLREAYLPFFQALKPVPEIQKIINNVHLPERTVALHIRNASDWRNEGRYEKLEKFIECMKKFPKNTTFFLSAHTKEIGIELRKIFGNRILEIPNKDYHSIQCAVADLYLLSLCEQAIYSCGSTFSEFSWWLGGCKAKVQVVGSYEKWGLNSLSSKK